MWVLTPDGFYSAVALPGNPSPGLKVRPRVRDDLEKLLTHFPEDEIPLVGPGDMVGLKIVHTPANDYAYRVFLTNEQWGRVLAELGRGIDYGNFKDEVEHRQGPERHHVYGEIWYVLRKGLQRIDERAKTLF